MIYTLTLNPSVDYVIQLEELKLGELNRVLREAKFPGGKGINVSRVLQRMGVSSKALGFIGGFTGKYIEERLKQEKISCDFVHVKGDTRINVKLQAGTETEINASGPPISRADFEALKEKIGALTGRDVLVLAGSVPAVLPETTYEELVKICVQNGTKFVADMEGRLLEKVLPYRPFLIKPNHHELGELFHTEIADFAQAVACGKRLVQRGAENVIVSMADQGAVFVSRQSAFIAEVPKGEVKSSVGAGDSMVAGFLAKYGETGDVKEAFRYSVASGCATAFSLDLCTKEKVEEILPHIIIKNFGGDSG
ncbi:MAG: 1-phosphofructokinase [Caldibacillus debilis]|uniref:Tagatose-6-phosphate kinase n=1 Tax=Caldibacillus debilis TaxID=301148 RepID=A0A3E0K7C1_9BACI|nr:1-phosphofructokinase [Caldibacillus debilis]REJ30632.1 MAG: 1-phosphofructokinase [Caldibacillus debilis]